MTGRPLVLDASALFTPDATAQARAMVAALAAIPERFSAVVRIDGGGIHEVHPATLAARLDLGADDGFRNMRVWLLGEGPRPSDPRPSRSLVRFTPRRAASQPRLPRGAVMLVPGHSPWGGRLLTALHRARADLRLVALAGPPALLDWPEYDEQGAAARVLAAMAAQAAAIVVPDEPARDRLMGQLAARHGSHVPVRPMASPPLLPASATAAADDALRAVPYLLAVDRIEARANTALLLHVWRGLIAAGGAVPRLVLAGARGKQVEEIRPLLAWNAAIRDHVAEAAGLSTAGLAHLVRCSRGVLAPAFAQEEAALLRDVLALGVPLTAAGLPAAATTPLDPLDGPGWRAAIAIAADRPARPPAEPGFTIGADAFLADLAALADTL